jgi:hypothetical protein
VEMIWIEKTKKLFNLKIGDKVVVVFQGKPTTKTIIKVKTGCGCYQAKLDNVKSTITLSFKVPSTPRHLLGNSYFTVNKSVRVLYNDGSSDLLTAVGTVKIGD